MAPYLLRRAPLSLNECLRGLGIPFPSGIRASYIDEIAAPALLESERELKVVAFDPVERSKRVPEVYRDSNAMNSYVGRAEDRGARDIPSQLNRACVCSLKQLTGSAPISGSCARHCG
jgi:hypothetical protein